MLGGILLMFLWERTRRRRAGMRSRLANHVGFEFRYGLRLALEVLGLAALAVGVPTGHTITAAVGGALVVGMIVWEQIEVSRTGARPRLVNAAVEVAGIGLFALLLNQHLFLVALAPLAVALLAWLMERVAHERSRILGPFWIGVFQEGFPVVVCLFLLPLVVYLFTYSGRFEQVGYPPYKFVPGLSWSWMWTHPSRLADETYQMWYFHDHLLAQQYDSKTKKYTPAHPYQSRPWSWIALGRPVAYYYQASHDGTPQERRTEVLGIGNPAIFWLQFIAIPWLAVMWRRRRDWRAGLILIAILFQYGFWFLPHVSLQKVQFFFYATPIAPFFVLAAAYMIRDLSKMRLQGSTSRPFLPVAIGLVILSVALFAWFFPVLSGMPLTVSAWKARIWFGGWI
ncbi:MAG TPA: hypothetical protein VNN79_07445 [Actinomycetota bacterium]|nr:hypothetical protein [Actinomycetota bacterium]